MSEETGSQSVRAVRGSAIRDLLAVTERPGVISLAGGLPAADLLPTERVARAASAALRSPSALQYGLTTGAPALRDVVHARESAALGRDAGAVVVTHGSQQALSLLAQALLNPGDVVIVEDPGYIGALQAFDTTRARVIGLPMDADGMRVDELRPILERERVRVVHTVSNFHNPGGATLPEDRRRELARLADEFGFWIIEDDPYGELRFAGTTVPPVAACSDRVLRLSSASKIVAPSLRVGWMHGDASVLALVERLKQGADLCGSSLTQAIAAELLADAAWLDAHIDGIRALYAERALALHAALVDAFGDRLRLTTPEGGMFLWGEFTDGTTTSQSLSAAVDAGVAYVPGSAFAVRRDLDHALRLCFTTGTPDDLREAVRRLSTVL
ncbi:aminotransferase-like domain-containing protein [Tsukamurella ocularis]|uniref:aminotransferase-like domain-containing protein n=1 Tax=Tsukamurella ocularis TaxID=1970234 RepID=UPI002166E83E|nr:PLP-dependent aminotransferase family protein [Tsukamurella ocularis]MCS3781612.1 2-aminoadipate transaminase [Tsukamurella ocularis]MCS3788106.1 2-aminoadipate transaminase [Tsukamurella ocularis]MCS3851826.1 2-aminoadipate transaminase [Tsukamurella ocularis]